MQNKTIGCLGAAVTGLGVLAFAISMAVGLFTPALFACCLSSIFIALGFVPFMAALNAHNDIHHRASSHVAMAFAAIYATIILLVYYAECTTVHLHPELPEEALSLISFGHLGSLAFNYDLLGYAMMALSTFFTGLSLQASNRSTRLLRGLLIGHGAFFPGCLIMPMFPVFTTGGSSVPGTILLEIWCLYFLPICILGFLYFGRIPDADSQIETSI